MLEKYYLIVAEARHSLTTLQLMELMDLWKTCILLLITMNHSCRTIQTAVCILRAHTQLLLFLLLIGVCVFVLCWWWFIFIMFIEVALPLFPTEENRPRFLKYRRKIFPELFFLQSFITDRTITDTRGNNDLCSYLKKLQQY